MQDNVEKIKTKLKDIGSDIDEIKKQTSAPSSIMTVFINDENEDDEYELKQISDYSYKEDIQKCMEESINKVEKELNIGVKEKIKLKFVDGLESAAKGADAGVKLAKSIPVIGNSVITLVLGAGIGAIGGFFSGVFGGKKHI